MIDSLEIGRRMANLRKSKKMSQEELAKALKTSPSTIGMWERGERIPRDEMKVQISKYFNTSVESIFFN